MDQTELQEQLLSAWIGLNAVLKDSHMTRDLTYNEAVVMNLVFARHSAGEERTPVQYLLRATNRLKSQMNRTVDALCARGFLVKEREGRSLYVRAVEEKRADFLLVHQRSLERVRRAIDIIGEEDAKAFVRVGEKLSAAGLRLSGRE